MVIPQKPTLVFLTEGTETIEPVFLRYKSTISRAIRICAHAQIGFRYATYFFRLGYSFLLQLKVIKEGKLTSVASKNAFAVVLSVE